MASFLKDPLAHFLAAGLVLFVIGNVLKPPTAADDAIVVDRPALLDFIQYRSKAFNADAAEKILNGLSDQARQRLIDEYVREEALAREAAAMGLDENDYVIRQRMVQKVEFLAEAAARAAPPPTDAALEDYYALHRDRYASPPAATLTHVFVASEGKAPDAAKAEAEALLESLIGSNAQFNDATRYGERFLFHKNYVDRTQDYIESQLGEEVTRAAFDSETPLNTWTGPFRSVHGEHLIFITARTPASLAPLLEIKDLVAADFAEEQRRRAVEVEVAKIVEQHDVIIRLDPP